MRRALFTLCLSFTIPVFAANVSDNHALDSLTAAELGGHIKVLSSDAFGGRAPGAFSRKLEARKESNHATNNTGTGRREGE